ncbi:MAG: hypothetical protein HY926_09425 [Elusimicrobia bacterium]|nr:hypothetical protein [Elusimicrobiota bacterium]
MLAPAREAAYAQFSAPWDPDFSQQQPRKDEPSPVREGAPPPEEQGVLPSPEGAEAPVAIIPGSGPFLLLERPDPGRILEPLEAAAPPAVSTQPPHEFLDFVAGLRPFVFSQDRYAQARTNLDLGRAPGEPSPFLGSQAEDLALSTATRLLPPPPELELPAHQMSLSITGRKVIGFNFSEKRYLNDQSQTGRPKTTALWDIEQQMQLRMQGKVGPKITVNVDYDDTKENQQDISIVYQGDPNEVVQNVSFGDIDLSLPPTEFVSYNKQLFGIRADVKWKGLKSSVIASRTKGTSKFKEFVGNTQFVAADLLDTGYVRRQYYDIGFGTAPAELGIPVNRLPIQSGTEQVWLSQMNTGIPNVNQSSFTADDLAYPNQLSTGAVTSDKWTRLSPGTDYTIDYVNGIISFRYALQPQWAVAIDYIDKDGAALSRQTFNARAGGSGLLKVIKMPSDIYTSTATETGWNRELKTVYNLGQIQIVRDDGRGNFILQVQDQQRNEVGSALIPVQRYPDTVNVDFEAGTFRLLRPFSVSNSSPTTADPDVYSPTPISKRLIHVEYRYRLRTFLLEPTIVPQSETVTLDGVRLNRNVDYFIDYDSGFITFFNPDRIGPNSRVNISYEVSPLGGLSNTSLLGTRVSYDITKNISLGSTLLYQAGAKSQSVPNVTDLASSLLVYDFDLKLKDIRLLPKLKASFAGEFAQSRQNPNLNDRALIDNMEGIKQEDSASPLFQAWQIATNPNYPGSTQADPGGPAPLKWTWTTEGIKVLDINKNAQANADDTQQVLSLTYDFSNAFSTQEVSIAYPFSVSGLDFSQKTVLQVVMLGDQSNNLLNFRLGGVDENADGSGGLRTEDVNGNGVLDVGEDIGWCYQRPAFGACEKRYGAGNGVIDSEDLNKNGRLDPDDGAGGDFGYMCRPGQAGGTGCAQSRNNGELYSLDTGVHAKLDFGGPIATNAQGWQTFQIPLNISSANLTSWQVIKEIRISVRNGGAANGAANAGPHTVKFAHIGVVGTTWQRGTAGDPSTGQPPSQLETLVAVPANSVENSNYVPIFNAGGDAAQVYNDLYGGVQDQQRQQGTSNVSEQSLQLEFSSMTLTAVAGSTTTVYSKRSFSRALDISQHKRLVFLLYGNADGGGNFTDHQFFLRAGNDTNFWEARVPLDFTGWRKITINQISSGDNGVQDSWTSGTSNVVIVSSGLPSLQQVAQLVAGVRKLKGGPSQGRIWLDEIHLTDPVIRVGQAHSISADFDWTGWATFGLKNRSVDRNFQTPTSVVSNQDSRFDSAYLNFRRISFFPMSFTLNRSITVTPNTALTGNLSNLINQLQTGKVTNWNGSAQGNFARGAWPRLSLSLKRNRTEYETLTRLDDSIDYSGAMQYGVPLNSRFLPKTVDLNYGHKTDISEYSSLAVRQILGNSNTRDVSQTYGARLTFIPWTGSSFNPTYSLTKVAERRADLRADPAAPDGVSELVRRYPKSMNQSAGMSANFRILSWLNPQVNYQADIIENTLLSVSTVVTNATYYFDIGDVKTVNRSANGSVSLPFNVAEVYSRSKLFRSVNIVNGYQIQDGDVWNNVPSGYQSNLDLWVRTPMRPGHPAAQLANRTLRDTFNSTQRWSPLSAYELRGRWSPLKTFSISNNYVRSIQRSEVTGTLSKTLSTTFPDLVASISQLELLLHSERWMSNTQMNFRYAAHKTENVGATIATDQSLSMDLRSVIRRRFDTLISYNQRSARNLDLRVDANTQKTAHQDATVQVNFNVYKVYLTPKVDYTFDQTTLGTGVKTQDVTVITPSLLTRMDVALPRGLLLPGAKKPILFSNRIIWTTTLSLAHRRSPVTQADNSDLASMNTSGDYEIAKNLRLTLNGAMSRLWHKYLKQEDYISYSMGTTLTFQF